jgi:Uncharacterized protein involved in response to NO
MKDTSQFAPPLSTVLADEGFRLFFPLAAAHAALWPFLWVAVQGYLLIGATEIASSVWHMHEMIVGSFGAALIGFLTTAFPEWTDTPKLQGRALWSFAAIWGVARLIGLIGFDALTPLAALGDLAWMAGLILYGIAITWRKRTDRLLAFLPWLVGFFMAEAITRYFMITGDSYLAGEAVKYSGLVFLGVLGLALARITVPVTNLVLDPSEETSPYRPHPGRKNLAPGLVAFVLLGKFFGLSDTVVAWLMIATGAGFLDRAGEGFIGRETFRVEIIALTLPSLLSGAGLIWLGASALGAPVLPAGGWHLALMGGLGVAVLAVLSIAGLFHAGLTLPVGGAVKTALVLLVISVVLRILPELGMISAMAGHLSASVFWAAGFGLWLWRYWPILTDPDTLGPHEGC